MLTIFTDSEILADMDIEQIIELLGGEAPLAKELGCGVSAISNWKVRGIPPGRRFDLLALAQRKKIELTIPDVEAANRIIVERRSGVAA